VSNKSFNSDQAAKSIIMGSTTFGTAVPTTVGFGEPTTFKIDRARFDRVRIGGSA
jgi:hypothetical protein